MRLISMAWVLLGSHSAHLETISQAWKSLHLHLIPVSQESFIKMSLFLGTWLSCELIMC